MKNKSTKETKKDIEFNEEQSNFAKKIDTDSLIGTLQISTQDEKVLETLIEFISNRQYYPEIYDFEDNTETFEESLAEEEKEGMFIFDNQFKVNKFYNFSIMENVNLSHKFDTLDDKLLLLPEDKKAIIEENSWRMVFTQYGRKGNLTVVENWLVQSPVS